MNKATILLLLTITSCMAFESKVLDEYISQGYDILEHPFGNFQAKLDESNTHIFDTGFDIRKTPTLLNMFKNKFKQLTIKDIDDAIIQCSKGKEPDYFKWLSSPMGVVGNNGQDTQVVDLVTDEDTCFKTLQLTYTKTSKNSYTLEFVGTQRQGAVTCSNIVQIASAETMHLPVLMTFATPKHTVNVENQSDAAMLSISKWGLRIFQTCDKVANLIPDLLMTAQLFIGGLSTDPNGEGIFNSKPTPEQDKANVEFIKNATGYEWKERNPVFVDLRDYQIKSGDYLIITRMDGLDQIIEWGAGGHVGHTVVALEMDGQMHIVESQDGWYWPKHGIQKNTWSQWKEWALNCDMSVAVLPLTDAKREIFNANIDKAIDFFNKHEGLPYGYHNFLFGWLDDVKYNVPAVSTMDYLYVIFCQLDKLIPDAIASFMGEPLNKRLGTEGKNLAEIANIITDRGMTIDELFGIPEQDKWVYSDGASMVCSAFVTGIYKAAGLFEGVEVQATEFTPRDIYQLNFFNTTATRPKECVSADPDLPYCQVMGKWKMDITDDKWSTIRPYDNMFERCPSEAPFFERDTSYPNGC